ncbi:MAG: hypothetical protein ACP5US_11450 [Candidatus Kryptoniota bacterium]
MSYAIRNTIVLAGFLILIFGVGFYLTRIQQPSEVNRLQKEAGTYDAVIAQRPQLEKELKESKERLADMKDKYEHRFKVIPVNDTTAETYAYLNRIMDASGFVKFDMLYQGAKQLKRYGYNTYNLRGETSYDNLFRFIWYLEHAKLLYKISDLSVSGHEYREQAKERTKIVIPFTMELRAYYSTVAGISSPSMGPDLTLYKFVRTGTDPLKPLISSEPPPNIRGLVDVERSDLRAVLPDKVFIVDEKGKTHILREGDEVYLGYLTRINPSRNEAEFTLNKGGIIDRVVLKVRFGK